MAAVWGVVLSATTAITLLAGLAVGVLPHSVFGAPQVFAATIRGLCFGAMAGAIFALALSAGERRQTLGTLSAHRAALWGALGGACVPACALLAFGAGGRLGGALGVAVFGASTLMMGAMGGALGSGTVRLAQRGERWTLRGGRAGPARAALDSPG